MVTDQNENNALFFTKDNTEPYTPTEPYHPATKKYVEDSITESGNVTPEQVERWDRTDNKILPATCTYSSGIFTLSGLPVELPDIFTVRFKAPAAYTLDDKISIGETTYTVLNYKLLRPDTGAFASGALVQMNIDNLRKLAFYSSAGIDWGVPGQPIANLPLMGRLALTENGVEQEFYVVHHDYENSGRILLLRRYAHSARQWHSSGANTYAACTLDAWFNGDYLGSLDEDIQDKIETVEIPYTVGNGNWAVSSLNRKVFALSGSELDLTHEPYLNVEGEPLIIAVGIRITEDEEGIKRSQWTRSAITSNKSMSWAANSNGRVAPEGVTTLQTYARPAFTLPADLLVSNMPDENGVYHIVEGGYDPVLANNTWEQIDQAIVNDEIPATWSTGDTKPFELDGVEYHAQIIGFKHDNLTGGGKAGITFETENCLNTTYPMNATNTNVGGWNSSKMRTETLPALFAQLPPELQAVIKPVDKLTSAGNKSTAVVTSSDKLFLLSESEIFNSTNGSADGEGLQYEYYQAGNSKVKIVSGSANIRFNRSPQITNTTGFCLVDQQGKATYGPASSGSWGTAFAFCI